jgi:nitrogen fixation/metabolism regulation signal transduction histidine kinase
VDADPAARAAQPTAPSRPSRLGLRGRLLAGFALVAVPPILLLGFASSALLARSAEAAARQRLDAALRSAADELARRRQAAAEQAEGILTDDLPSAEVAANPLALAARIAEKRALDVLEVLDAEGRVISSSHWPAAFGFLDRAVVFPGQDALRVVTVKEGDTGVERLAVTAARRGRWRDQDVQVRAGWLVDDAFAAQLSALVGLELALRDQVRGRWVAPQDAPLQAWAAPVLEEGPPGQVALGGAGYRWAARRIAPELWLVAALPRETLDAVAADIRRLSLALAAATLVAALVGAVALSGRIARPVRELAEGARRVAAGDLEAAVPVATRDEIGLLAGSFNAMTADLRDSRERLLQAERVAAWREMARRLAHELKNPLFPIQLSIETLRRVLDQEQRGEAVSGPRFAALFRESSETIIEELGSLRKIIDEFSQFARMPRPQPAPTDVNVLVEHTLALHRARGDGVAIETELGENLPPANVDRDLLARALGNLVANALEAMPEGGTLRVRTAAEPPGVSVQVEDTGPGLNEEQRTRLFTPYYTTKRGGTGLGLAIVQGIVSDHGGRVQVKSEPGKGTTFTLLLPSAPVPKEAGAQ